MLKFRKMMPADYEDVDRLMSLLHGMHVEARPDMYVPAEHIYSREEYLRRASGDGWIALLAEDGGGPEYGTGRVIGILFAELRDRTCMSTERSAYIHDLIVAPDVRREKIGTMLYRMAEREARERGAVRLDLAVWSFNEDALAFYRAMGLTIQRVVLEKDIREENFTHGRAHGE